jgi:hypothetical protein
MRNVLRDAHTTFSSVPARGDEDGAAILGGAMLGATAVEAQVSSPALQTRTSTGRRFAVWSGT